MTQHAGLTGDESDKENNHRNLNKGNNGRSPNMTEEEVLSELSSYFLPKNKSKASSKKIEPEPSKLAKKEKISTPLNVISDQKGQKYSNLPEKNVMG